MRTLIKTLLWIFGILIILYLAASFLLMRLVSPTVISALESSVSKQLHTPAKIAAQFHLRFFPQPAVTLSNATMELGTNHVRSTIQKAHIALKFRPLLSRQIVPAVLELQHADIDLANIQGISKSPKQTPKSPAQHVATPVKKSSTPSASSAPSLPSMSLPRVIITNSQFKWQNARTKRITTVSNVNLSINPAAASTRIKGEFTLSYDKKSHQLKIDTQIKQPSLDQINFDPLQLDLVSKSHDQTSTLNMSTTLSMNRKSKIVKLSALKGKINGVPFSGTAQTKWQTQGVQLINNSNLSLRMAGGQLHIGFNYQSPAEKAKLAVNAKSVNLNTVSHALQLDNPMKGTAALQASLTAQKQHHQWVSGLNGNGRFQLNDVQFGKTDFGAIANEGAKRFHQQSNGSTHGVTTFSAITGTFNIHDGVFYNDDLALQTKNNQLSGKGNGHINLTTKQINYTLTLTLEQLNNFALPLEVKGSINHPKVRPDFEALGKNLIKKAIKKHSFKSLFHDKKINLKSLF